MTLLIDAVNIYSDLSTYMGHINAHAVRLNKEMQHWCRKLTNMIYGERNVTSIKYGERNVINIH